MMDRSRNQGLAALRLGVTLLVVLHHTVLAYCQTAHFDHQHYLWSTAPIVDRQRWFGFDILADANDSYFMSLMFLLSGVFVLPSLARKGAARYARDRLWRLGLPFLVSVTLLTVVVWLWPGLARKAAVAAGPQCDAAPRCGAYSRSAH